MRKAGLSQRWPLNPLALFPSQCFRQHAEGTGPLLPDVLGQMTSMQGSVKKTARWRWNPTRCAWLRWEERGYWYPFLFNCSCDGSTRLPRVVLVLLCFSMSAVFYYSDIKVGLLRKKETVVFVSQSGFRGSVASAVPRQFVCALFGKPCSRGFVVIPKGWEGRFIISEVSSHCLWTAAWLCPMGEYKQWVLTPFGYQHS